MKYYIIEDTKLNRYIEYAESEDKAIEQCEEKNPGVVFSRIEFHGDNPPAFFATPKNIQESLDLSGFEPLIMAWADLFDDLKEN